MLDVITKRISNKISYLSLLPIAIYAPNAFSYLLGANIEIKNNTNFRISFGLNAPNINCQDQFGYYSTSDYVGSKRLVAKQTGQLDTIQPHSTIKMCVDNFDFSGLSYQTAKATFSLTPFVWSEETQDMVKMEPIATGEIHLYTGPTLWNMAAYFTNEKIIENDSYSITLNSTPKLENSEWVSAGSIVNLSLDINGKKLK